MELKLGFGKQIRRCYKGFNRTFMELKFQLEVLATKGIAF